MQKNRTVLTCDSTGSFFLVYKCVNDVSSYGTFYFSDSCLDERCSSVHLRSGQDTFVDQMTRRLYPLYDSSSHLCFPTTSLNNVTSRGWDVDPVFYGAVQAAYLGDAFGRLGHVRTRLATNNRNYTALIHGVQNRQECLSAMEKLESLKFSRNSSFPPLTWNARYDGVRHRDVVSRSQIYDNSFAVNTQRQTDCSLQETSESVLSHVLKFACVDFSANHLCTDWEVRLGRGLSFPEKCQLLVFLEVARHRFSEGSEPFQTECSRFPLKKYDGCFSKNMFGVKRSARRNPEMGDLLHRLPEMLAAAASSRLAEMQNPRGGDGNRTCPRDWHACRCPVPSQLDRWTDEHVHMVARCLELRRCQGVY